MDSIEKTDNFVFQTYLRQGKAFVKGEGTTLWDEDGKKYTDFFGRKPDFIREPLAEPQDSPFVYRFPAIKVGFLKRFRVPVNDVWVFITDGMSLKEMTVPHTGEVSYPSRIELVAYAKQPIIGQSDDEDIISAVLQALSLLPFEKNRFFGPLLTCGFGERICLNSEMTGFFFGVPDGVNMTQLCKCTYVSSFFTYETTELLHVGYTSSKIPAAPIPPPMHMVTMP